MTIAIRSDDTHQIAAEIASVVYEASRGRVERDAIVDLVVDALTRYAAAPVKDFVPLLVEREVLARIREGGQAPPRQVVAGGGPGGAGAASGAGGGTGMTCADTT